jgi:hypothetical protein
MKKLVSLLLFSVLLIPVTVMAQAMVAAPVATGGMHEPSAPGFLRIVMCGGPVAILNWIGILFWAVAAVPLGILSIVHCSRTRVRQLPLATKLLACGGVWLFIIGLVGTVHGSIFAFATLSMTSGAAQSAMLALNIAEALYTLSAALFFVQLYLLLFVISIMVVHFSHRKILMGNP